jgi:NAD(P)-dependent dehydrogenase (short-subunit alcohol dehydrogenase family)
VDVLVNNAGVAESAPLARTSDASWSRAIDVNVTAVFRLCRAVLPGMAARGWGRVITVASNAGLTGYAYTSAYCASKHAVVGLTRALAAEFARKGVTVNAVCPGFVDTEMTERAVANIVATTGRDAVEARAALAGLSPQKRLMTPDEVAHAVFALVPHEARGINGQAIALDGGQVLR